MTLADLTALRVPTARPGTRQPVSLTEFWTSPAADLLDQLQASSMGLSEDEARLRLARFGPNQPVQWRPAAGLVQFLLLFANPLVVILLLACVVSAVLGEAVSASIIVLIVLLSILLNFAQTYRSQQAARKLQASVAPQASVRRDGRWVDLPRRLLVPGDLIRLSAGDLVPADARLLEARDLHIQQAALTGESLPTEKTATDAAAATDTPGNAVNAVFLGTSVSSGIATAVVIHTGSATVFGDIAARISARAPETEFERGTRQFSLLIMRTVFFLVLFVFLVNIASHKNPFETLLFSVALAVGLTPEFLPMISTVKSRTGRSAHGAQAGYRQAPGVD